MSKMALMLRALMVVLLLPVGVRLTIILTASHAADQTTQQLFNQIE
jgi:hypothetical protein